MPPASEGATEWSDADLHAQREALRRGLRRANAASVLILMLLVALAFGFVWKARQSAREAERASEEAQRANAEANRARQASSRAENELWNARLNEARARRVAGGPGARIGATAILQELVQRPDLVEEQLLALRQEAIAQLALVDVTPATNWIAKDDWRPLAWNGALTHHVRHSPSREIEVREHPSERVVASFRGFSNALPRASILTPDGRLLATRFSGSDVLVWDLSSSNLLLKSRCHHVAGLAGPLLPSPDSRALVMFTGQGLVIQPLEANGMARALQPGRIVVNAVFTHDAQRLAVFLANKRNGVEVWDVASGATLQQFDVGFRIQTLEWHPDGRRLAVSGDQGRLGIWDITPTLNDLTLTNKSPTGGTNAPREVLRLDGHISLVDYTMFTPDGSCLLSHAFDRMNVLWDVTSGKPLLAETRVHLRVFDARGKKVVGMVSNELREAICAFHPRTGFRTVGWAGELRAINGIWLSPDSRLLALVHPASPTTPRGECRLWDFKRGVEIARLPGIWAQFSPDGRFLYTFEVDALRRHELRAELLAGTASWPQGEIILRRGPEEAINAGTLSADGRTLALGAVKHVKLVDLDQKSVLRQFIVRTHNSQLSADGSLLGTRFQNEPGRLRNPTNGAVLTQMVGVVEFVFSPDNKWVLAKGVEKLHLLDAKSLAVVREIPLELGAGSPPSTVFSPDGETLAVVHNRFDVRLLELPTGRELATFCPPHPAQAVWSHGLAFSSDGRSLVMAKQDGEIVAWDLPVIRAELAKLGLDWGMSSLTGVPASRHSAATFPEDRRRSVETPLRLRASFVGSPALTMAFGAVALALAAGLVVALNQRRMLSAYVRADALTVEQHRQLQTAQEQLQHSQKMRALGTLSAGIAHDFNNLLSVIRLSNQLAAEQTAASGTAKENMDAIESAVSQGETIVQSMLGYSRAAAELENEYSIAAAVSETVAMLGKKFLSGIVLKLEVQPDIPPVRGVRGRLEQMLLNLVVNASEAMNGQGTLQIVARVVPDANGCILKPQPAGRYVAVSVGDSGPGISPEILPRIFDPFFTTKSAGARPGTGLGLSTVYTMAQQDGLGLAVEASDGAGATFRILVPIADEAQPAPQYDLVDERKMPSASPVRAG